MIHLPLGKGLVFLFLSLTCWANSSGAPEGHTGAPGEQTCTVCHTGTVNSGRGRLRIEFPSAGYTPGQTSRMRVILEDPAASRWGFELTARLESAPQTRAGTLASVDGNTMVNTAGAMQWITHTAAGTRRGTTGSVTFEFNWTAPATDAGAVVFYAAGNAANGNGTVTGDNIYTTSLRVAAESGGGARPTFTASSVVDAFTARPGMAPGAWVTIQGSELAGSETHWTPVGGRTLDTRLGGVTVKVNDAPAVLSFVSPTRITMLVPGNTPEGEVPVVIEREGAAPSTVNVRVSAALPAIHCVPDPSGNRFFASVTSAGAGTSLALLNPRGWILGNPAVDNRALRGVRAGEEIDIYAIGLGKTEGETTTDRLFANPVPLATLPTVRFGELTATPSLAAMIAPGLYLVRVKAPESLAAGEVALTLEVHGMTSAPNVFLLVQ
ncbi:MAG: IPT/TIG domain-containing protein [Bryobacteraceae bacterium]|nr:IPT/TIG domain-containing protein [Bryobacteraceae bacterium]MDW8379164.1 choice-of-anchor V domain-containing protein [Bryobacterales bacterium]